MGPISGCMIHTVQDTAMQAMGELAVPLLARGQATPGSHPPHRRSS